MEDNGGRLGVAFKACGGLTFTLAWVRVVSTLKPSSSLTNDNVDELGALECETRIQTNKLSNITSTTIMAMLRLRRFKRLNRLFICIIWYAEQDEKKEEEKGENNLEYATCSSNKVLDDHFVDECSVDNQQSWCDHYYCGVDKADSNGFITRQYKAHPLSMVNERFSLVVDHAHPLLCFLPPPPPQSQSAITLSSAIFLATKRHIFET